MNSEHTDSSKLFHWREENLNVAVQQIFWKSFVSCHVSILHSVCHMRKGRNPRVHEAGSSGWLYFTLVHVTSVFSLILVHYSFNSRLKYLG
jgi:hypothetical protein